MGWLSLAVSGAPEIQPVRHGTHDFVSPGANRWVCTHILGLSWCNISNTINPRSFSLRHDNCFGDSCTMTWGRWGGDSPVGCMALPGTRELGPFEEALGNILL